MALAPRLPSTVVRSPYLAHISARKLHAAAVANPAGANASAGPPTQIVRISPELLAVGGLDPSTQPPSSISAFQEQLAKGFLPVNIAYPKLRVVNVDPPVCTIDDFLAAETCDALRQAAAASGHMNQSGVGGKGELSADIRTSSTLAITKDVLAECPAIQKPLQQLLDTAVQLLSEGLDVSAVREMRFERPTGGQLQLCPELPQVAHYLPGQHFLSHEDGFPSDVALSKGYQRRATLLVYLNDVLEGGATKFDHLQLGVQPQKGKALLFFPSFSGGRPDARTLHTAEDAAPGHEKWVFQLWLCSGLPRRPPVDGAALAAQQLAAQRSKPGAAPSKKKKKKK